MADNIQRQYYEAILSGDKDLAESLKGQINEAVKTSQKHNRVSPIHINTLLNDDHTPAVKVYQFMNDKYGEDWYDLEFSAIEHDLWKDYGLIFTEAMADKMQAIKAFLNNGRFFLEWNMFNQLANSLCGSIADFTTIISPSPGMAIATVRMMKAIRPEEMFSRDVKKYICLLLMNDGIYCPPPSITDILIEEFDALVSPEMKIKWPEIFIKVANMSSEKEYADSDDMIDVQARRILIAEHAADKFGG